LQKGKGGEAGEKHKIFFLELGECPNPISKETEATKYKTEFTVITE
jgi:hypothetical protein